MNINNEDVDEDNNDDEQEEEKEKPIPAYYTEMLQKLEKALFENKYFTKKQSTIDNFFKV